ncbi:MAG: AraC family transcriptional regulator ligand-binding domain-containing protein [Chloroflexota bacterium]
MTTYPQKYILDTSWQITLKDMDLTAQDVLRHAGLPLDLLSRPKPTVTTEEYFRLWEGMTHIMQDDPTFPLKLGSSITAEAFSPPIFASFCSPNFNVAVGRIAHYKPLVGPCVLDIAQDADGTTVAFRNIAGQHPLPTSLIGMELAFFTRLIRLATREHIVPLEVTTTREITAVSDYEAYLGTRIRRGAYDGITFRAADATRPFLTANEAMWSIFEPDLQLRLDKLERDASFRERVRATLMETLASGQYSMGDVASRLAVSARTLQRRLRDEGTSFQAELDTLREELARNYLSRSDYTAGQIAFLLGYEDPNSFYRAFRGWTGQTPEVVRAALQ